MYYRCIFHSNGCGDLDRHLNVPADDVQDAIEVLKEQMEREGETLTKIITIAPQSSIIRKERRYDVLWHPRTSPPSEDDVEAVLCCQLGDDGLILDIEDQDGEIIATNGMDVATLTDMCK